MMVVQMMVIMYDDGVGVGGKEITMAQKKLPLIGLSPSILPSAMNLKGLGDI